MLSGKARTAQSLVLHKWCTRGALIGRRTIIRLLRVPLILSGLEHKKTDFLRTIAAQNLQSNQLNEYLQTTKNVLSVPC